MINELYRALRPLLFRVLPPETAHDLALMGLRSGLFPRVKEIDDPTLRVTLWDRVFPNPVGLAGGFDKNALALRGLFGLGFGFIEAGTVTPRPQEGNPRPRIFRCPQQEAVINRMGFPNQGLSAFRRNLEGFLEKRPRPAGLVGISIGMNKAQTEPEKDYVQLVRALGPLADYLAINVSSPNTPGLRDLQQKKPLTDLLNRVMEERTRVCAAAPPPVLLKLMPDLDAPQLAEIADVAQECSVDGVILTNTTLARPDNLPSAFAGEKGGLSGAPVREKSTRMIRDFYALTEGKIPVVGVGGIFTARDAYDKIRAGASLVQVYTGFIYQGPFIAAEICRDLAALLRADGFSHISQAVGADHPRKTAAA